MKLFELGTRPARFQDVLIPFADLESASEARAVLLEPQHDPDDLKPWLARIELIVLQFPVFRDGRPFTQARHLREYLKYDGEIRAEGHVLPDQAAFLRRCGVDSVVLPEGSDPVFWEQQLRYYPVAYQEAID